MTLVFTGCTVRTLDPSAPVADTLTIDHGRILEGAPADAARVDLDGACVLPGFTDSHAHFPTWSLGLRQARLEGARSLDEALERVASALPEVAPGGWLRGLGWRDGDWPDSASREALDRVVPDTPAALMSRDYHSLWLNSAALARANAPLETPGGVVERDGSGELTGIIRETAAWSFRDRYLRPTVEEMVEGVRTGLRVAAERGVTAIHDKDGWLGAFEVYERLEEEDALTLRVWQSFPWDRLDELAGLGLRSGFGSDLLRMGYLKGFMDGTLGSATARLLDGSGVEITTGARLEEIIRRAAAAHWPVGVHAIGDAANRAALDAFEASRDVWEPRGLRQRIEHAQLLDAPDLERFARIGVTASVQFSHAPSDRDLADRLWEGRAGAYAYRSLRDAGTRMVNGSDAPVEELDPVAGIAAGVRRTLDERPSWRPEETVTVADTLEAACAAPAWLEHREHERGRLRPGMLADVVVLDRDPLTCPPEELQHLRVLATLVGGRVTYSGSDVSIPANPGTI